MSLCRDENDLGLGEGGAAPINYSLAAETFSVKQRGLVMSIVTAGSPISGIITPVLVAYLAQSYGWRAAFFFVGAPGLALAILIRLTLKEPREQPDADLTLQRPGTFWSDARFLLTSPAYVLSFIAAAFTGAAIGAQAFRVSFLIRVHHIKLAEAGGILSIASLFGVLGAFFGGWLADRLADERGRSYCYIPGITGLLTCWLTTAAFLASDLTLVTVFLSIGAFIYAMKEGPITAAVQNIVLPRMRATAAAVHMIAPTVIGGSIGPVLAGAISDHVAAKDFAGQAASFAQTCPGGHAARSAGKILAHLCASASGHGVKTALIAVGVTYAIGGVFFLLAALYVRRGDAENVQLPAALIDSTSL